MTSTSMTLLEELGVLIAANVTGLTMFDEEAQTGNGYVEDRPESATGDNWTIQLVDDRPKIYTVFCGTAIINIYFQGGEEFAPDIKARAVARYLDGLKAQTLPSTDSYRLDRVIVLSLPTQIAQTQAGIPVYVLSIKIAYQEKE